jgi:hypothetical protein
VEAVERLDLVDRTTFIVTGDHGSIDVHTALLPNVWLSEAGIAPYPPRADAWRVAFHASGGSAFLRTQDGIPKDELLASVHAMLEALPHGVRTLFRIVDRPELDRLGADPNAALALAAEPGVVFSPERQGPSTQAAHGAGHGYHPIMRDMMTGFVSAGAGVRCGAVVPVFPIEHIAPFIAALLGLEMPDVDGTLLPGLLATTEEVAPSRRP